MESSAAQTETGELMVNTKKHRMMEEIASNRRMDTLLVCRK
jgi:hypothetical protein